MTAHPTADWVVQQLRETFPDSTRHRYVTLDPDAKLSREVLDLLVSPGVKAVRTSIRSAYVIALNEAHARRPPREYLAYHHADRTHDGLDKDTPSDRAIEPKPTDAELTSLPRVGRLHHRYVWKAAA